MNIKFSIPPLILLMLLAASPVNAADALSVSDPPPGSELQLFIENDTLARTDRYYTNGIKFGVGLPFDLLQFPAASMLRSIDPDNGADIHVGLFLGQNIYTPRDITIAAPQTNDRPWAAWLYLGGVAQRVRGNRLDTAELDLGFVGPAALGKPVQKQWHRLIGVEQPRGWDNQSRNEPAFMLSYLQKRRFGNRNADLIVHGGATIGTVMTLVRSGVMARFGQRMTGFGPDTIEPGGAMLRGTRSVDIAPNSSEWFAFTGIDHRLVARNAFLDGPAFSNGPSLDRRNHVFDLSLGFSARLSGFNFSWTRILRSEEFLTTTGGGGKQRFDSINIGFEF